MTAEPLSAAQSSVVRYHTLDSDVLYGWNIDISEILFSWQSLAASVAQSHWHCGLRTYSPLADEHDFVGYHPGVACQPVRSDRLDFLGLTAGWSQRWTM